MRAIVLQHLRDVSVAHITSLIFHQHWGCPTAINHVCECLIWLLFPAFSFSCLSERLISRGVRDQSMLGNIEHAGIVTRHGWPNQRLMWACHFRVLFKQNVDCSICHHQTFDEGLNLFCDFKVVHFCWNWVLIRWLCLDYTWPDL